MPDVFRPLLEDKSRYKVFYGGRGGGKSVAFADALLIIGAQRKIRVLCTRELQKSISDSVLKLLKDRAVAIGLQAKYEISEGFIRGKNGTEFIFKGLRANATEIKSTEGIDYCWVEEAQSISDASLDILLPTIRKEGSEVWFSFNPLLQTDPVYKRFIVNKPSDSIIVKVNWYDNPYFPDVLRIEMENMKADPEKFRHVWEGECLSQGSDRIFGYDELYAAINRKTVSKAGTHTLSVDVARFGDDKTVISRRKGQWIGDIEVVGTGDVDTQRVTYTASRIKHLIMQDRPDAVFIDAQGIGGGVIDILHAQGFGDMIISCNYNTPAYDKTYRDRKAEMYHALKRFLETGQIPDHPELVEELLSTTYSYNNKGEVFIPKKEDIKTLIGRSPDFADSIAQHFYDLVVPRGTYSDEYEYSEYEMYGAGDGAW